MTVYRLYLESGPKHKKTMVHILDLLGCIATGATTEEALAKTPQAIQTYLHFLQRHGEISAPDTEIETQIAEHITEGGWLGNGSYDIMFAPDLTPLTTEELETYIRRLEWSRLEIYEMISQLSEEQLEEHPQSGERPIKAILEHVYGAEYAYVRTLGKIDGIRGPATNVQRSKTALLEWMRTVRTSELKKLRSLSETELSEEFARATYTRTTRRILRRMLEHEWEHLIELKKRLL